MMGSAEWAPVLVLCVVWRGAVTRGRRVRGVWRVRGLVWGVTRVQGDFVGNLLGDLLGNLDIRDLVQGHDLWTLRDPTEILNA